jgi:hypothetical protein
MRRNQTKHTVQVGDDDCFIDVPIEEVLESAKLCIDYDFLSCSKCVFEKYRLRELPFSFMYGSCESILIELLSRCVVHYRNMCQGLEISIIKEKKKDKKDDSK